MSYQSDRRLIATAKQELKRAPQVLGKGRAEALRSSTFLATRGGTCPRCGRPVRHGQRVRYHGDYPFPVHAGCRMRRRTASTPKPPGPKPIPLCPSCWTEHAGECL